MTDYFVVLDQPRRPWVEPQQLKQKYHELARSEHPDLDGNSSSRGAEAPPTLAAVNEAYRVLSSPRLRLQHLLALEDRPAGEGEKNNVAGGMGDLFMEAAGLVRDADALIVKRNGVTSALAKSLFQRETGSLGDRAHRLLEKLEGCYHVAVDDLRRADERWTTDRAQAVTELRPLIQRFAYLDRWIEQLREKQFQLAS